MTRIALSVFVLVAALTSAVWANPATRQDKYSPDGIWQEISDAQLRQSQIQRPIVPQKYRTFAADLDALRQLLSRAPMEFTGAARAQATVLTVPMPDGSYQRFSIEQSPVVEAGLIAKYPELQYTYRGQGIDDPTATMRFDLMPTGFHAMVLSTRDTVYVDPYATGDVTNYISYHKQDLQRGSAAYKCDFIDPNGDVVVDGTRFEGREPEVTNGSMLRTYRLALAATGEYTQAVGGGTVNGALAAQVLIMNRVNGVYEKDLAIHMNIIANNNLIIYTDGTTDPYTNSSGSTMLGQNQTNLDAVIGTANYDIGHVFSTGGGGVATLNSPCSSTNKARGVTGLPNPVGDPFAIDFVAHEMGHQFGARHTFNGSTGNCSGGNRTGTSAVEPGSGVTIMAYAGICGAQDLAPNSIDTFSVKSLEEILAFREAGGTCGPATATGNTAPAVTGPGNFTIPKGTPFALTASATDINGDSLTYDWNEYDFGPASPPDTDGDGQARPIFRQYLPTVGGTRTFPSMQYVLNNANVPPATTGGFLTGEILPSISRTMTFQVVVRDNRANGGGINTATSVLTVDGASGPFNVTSPNTNVNVFGGGGFLVTWNVAGTSGAPVSAANVKISLSTDGGNTFPTVLAASTPNDGSETVTIPNTPTGTARIKVEAVGNVFFDISDVNFSIVSALLAKAADFDGDGKTDLSVYRSGSWIVQRSTAGFISFPFGLSTDRIVPGDYDGDNKTDYAVFRDGAWYVQRSTAGIVAQSWGTTGDIPVPGDYDGDAKTDFAVYRPSTGTWYIRRSSDSVMTAQNFGTTGDIPVPGDYDADTKTDIAVFRPSTGTWYLLRSTAGALAQNFGVSGDAPVQSDYDGDGKTDLAVSRVSGSVMVWYLQRSTAGFTGFVWGLSTDKPSPGDYDGDNKYDVAVFRASSGEWLIQRSTTGSLDLQTFGTTGDISVPAAYIP